MFHAGDGNLHPILLFDERHPEEIKRVLAASDEILERMPRVWRQRDGRARHRAGKDELHESHVYRRRPGCHGRLRDALNPDGLLSPGKLLPTAGACGMEQVHPGRRAALVDESENVTTEYHREHRDETELSFSVSSRVLLCVKKLEMSSRRLQSH